MDNQKRFSIIIPVYNAAQYLNTSINGIIGQSYPFKNVEIILVNDGSSDNSKEICEKFQNLYPDNIIYYEQENSGPSAARNKGIELATGEIIGFLDADDKFSVKTLSLVNYYFNIAFDAVDLAVIPVQQFGAKRDNYYLNGKFSTQICTIDLNNAKWHDVCMRVGQAFIRAEIAKKHTFDESITFFEDSKYINEIIQEKMRIGVIPGCFYYYRRYANEADSSTSLTVGAETNTSLYLKTPIQVSLYFLEMYKDSNEAPLYFQYLALCEMKWRTFYTKNRVSDFLSAEQYSQYEQINESILAYISEYAILNCNVYQPWQKLYLLNLKHKRNLLPECAVDSNLHFHWNSNYLCDLNKTEILLLNMDFTKGGFLLSAYANVLCNDSIGFFVCANGQKYDVEWRKEGIPASTFPLDYSFFHYFTFDVVLPIVSAETEITFGFTHNEIDYDITNIKPSLKETCEYVVPAEQHRCGYMIRRKQDRISIIKEQI